MRLKPLLYLASFTVLTCMFCPVNAQKLSSSARALQGAFGVTREIGAPETSRLQAALRNIYNISGPNDNPVVSLIVTTSGPATKSDFDIPGVTTQYISHNQVFVQARFSALPRLAAIPVVTKIVPDKVMYVPQLVREQEPARHSKVVHVSRDLGDTNPVAFDPHGFTGKGVAVGIVDSGIDWKHPDFIGDDGNSRIAAIWDLTDTTFEDGKGGTAPPVKDLGTLYTNDQINQALHGGSAIATNDTFGHGTACAGTAAGNGRGKTNGVAAGFYKGVAPEAELIVARVGKDGTYKNTALASAWISDFAASRNEPLSLSLSFGNSYSGHTGDADEEQTYNSWVGAGKAGLSIAVASGNDRIRGVHAGGQISAPKEGVASYDFHAKALIESPATVIAVFDKGDDWHLDISGDDVLSQRPSTTFAKAGKRGWLTLTPSKDSIVLTAHDEDGATFDPTDNMKQMAGSNLVTQGDSVFATLSLPPGKYWFYPSGASSSVAKGNVDLYILDSGEFLYGVSTDHLVATPGNSGNVITVGAYNAVDHWQTDGGVAVKYNVPLGGLSPFSSPGYRRDGLVKPDICAPGHYMISAMASSVSMSHAPSDVVDGGGYLAWSGTSAATPYAAGVIALMLQKNPKLDVEQIRSILKQTATTDTFTGGVPNPSWGWGKLNPSAAISAVSAPERGASTQKSSNPL